MKENYLHVSNLYFKYDTATEDTLKDISFSLPQGSILGIQGSSGSGKSTILRLIAGLEVPYQGEISIDNHVVCSDTLFVEPEKRNIGMVFQDYALFPHLTVEKNIVFGVEDKNVKQKVLHEMLELVNIEHLAKRFPYELSGGEQQRVAIARAMARRPELLLLDEPFSNLDADLQGKIRSEIYEIIKKFKVTSIFVSHDTEDVLAVSDYILKCAKGSIVDFRKNK